MNQHTIFYTLPRHQAVIVEYSPDPTKDMYQVTTTKLYHVVVVVVAVVVATAAATIEN